MKRMAQLFLDIIQTNGLKVEQIGGIGIGVPGVLDIEKGETLFLPNLPGTWPHVPLRWSSNVRSNRCSGPRLPGSTGATTRKPSTWPTWRAAAPKW